MEKPSLKTQSYIFYIIAGFSFLIAFYELLHVADAKLAALSFLVAFLSVLFANYHDLEMVSALGFSAKFKKIETQAEGLIKRLTLQGTLLVDEMISSKLEMNRFMDPNLRWQQLVEFQKKSNQSGEFQYSDEQIKKIKTYFYFDFVNFRFAKLFYHLANKIRDEFRNFEAQNFPTPITNLHSYNDFKNSEQKAIEYMKIPELSSIDYSNFNPRLLSEKLNLAASELAKYNLLIPNDADFSAALLDLEEVLKSENILSDRNLELMSRARELAK